jgi:hypothetical protein
MGMHYGLLAATGALDNLMAALRPLAGQFEVGDTLPEPFVIKYGPEGELWNLAIGERDGRSFILDPNMMLSSDPDLVVAISRDLGLVVAGLAESISGTYSMTVARSGELVRHRFIQHSGMTEEFQLGTALAVEDQQPLDHPWGTGIWAVFDSLGLDVKPWMDGGPANGVKYTWEGPPELGAIGRAQGEHFERYARPKDAWLNELVIVAGGFDEGEQQGRNAD